MSKFFIIPDVHLKHWMFKKASEKIAEREYDYIVLLGDLVDDWDQQRNLELYQETLDVTIKFLEEHQNTLYCYGNHDVSYLFQAWETGYSPEARDIVVKGINRIIYTLPENNSAYIHRVDNILFSHAGLTERFVKRCFGGCGRMEIDEIIAQTNRLPKDKIWRSDSPIWARPQKHEMRLFPMGMMQVVGHTPVEEPLFEGKLLTLDTFSTFSTGEPIGNQKFVWIDTEKEEYHIID